MLINFTIYGEPMGKQRHRTGKGIQYTPSKTINYENLVKMAFVEKHAGKKINGQLKMTIKAHFSIPQSVSKKKREEMVMNRIRPTKKPDVDNICKIICDALNGVAYDDDKQIVSVTVQKYYAEQPFVDVFISEVNDLE